MSSARLAGPKVSAKNAAATRGSTPASAGVASRMAILPRSPLNSCGGFVSSSAGMSDVRERVDGTVVPHIAGVQRRGRLEEEYLDFLVCDRPMFDPARNDDQIAGPEIDRAITELHAKMTAMHEKELVLVLVMMPNEGALKLRELYLLTIELPDDLGLPVVI